MANTAPLIGTGLPNTNPLSSEAGNVVAAHAVALPDGQYVSVNWSGINRYRTDGTLDPAFGKQGEVRVFGKPVEGSITALAVTSDGRYLVAGHEGGLAISDPTEGMPRQHWGRDTSMFIQRYNADGSLDTSFGVNGKVTVDPGGVDSVQAIRVQRDGAIVLAGTTIAIDMAGDNGLGSERHVVLARFDSNGKPDSQFGKGGVVIAPDKLSIASDMQLLPDGTIVVAGKSWNGKKMPLPDSVEQKPWTNAPSILRFHADGSADTRFGTDGQLTIEYPAHLNPTNGLTMGRTIRPTLAVAPDGKYVLVLDAEGPDVYEKTAAKYFAVARFHQDGTADAGFGVNGWATPRLEVPPEVGSGEESLPHMPTIRAAVDGAGRTVLVTELISGRTADQVVVTRIAAQRLQADGTSDVAFGAAGQLTVELHHAIGLADLLLQPDGKFTLAGTAGPWPGGQHAGGSLQLLTKYLADGTPDLGWLPQQTANRIDYVQGRPDAVLNAGIAVYDRESMQLADGRGSYQGASLVLQREGGASADDAFIATDGVQFALGRVLVHGIDIGAVQLGGGVLRMDFSAAATGALVNDALAAIAYENLAAHTATTIRLQWTFNDGALSAGAVTTVALQPNAVPYWIDSLLFRHADKSAAQMAAYDRANLGPAQTVQYVFATDAAHGTYSASERALAIAQMQKIADVANVRYVPGDSLGSDGLVFHNFIREGHGNIAGEGSYPNYYGTEIWAPFKDYRNGDAEANAREMGRILQHELGHTLGLKHPFEAGGGGILPRAEAHSDATVMSYDTRIHSPAVPLGLGRLDIAALQYLYGPSQTVRTGDDTYVLTTAAYDANRPDMHNFIWDGRGTDTISGAGLSADITLYLEPGRWGYIGQRGHLITDAGQVTVNFGTVIENAIGGSGNDTLSGNGADNLLQGGAGNDVLTGLQGNDRLDGGAGIDTAVYGGVRSAYALQRGADGVQVSGAEGTDVLAGIERVAFADGMLALDTDGNAGAAYRLYRAALGREPDQAGLGYWIKMLDQGLSLADAARNFTASKEFASLYGGSHGTYLQALYHHVLQRAPDPAGLAWWTGQMAQHSVSEADVLLSFSNSAEFQAQVIGAASSGIAYLLYSG